MSKLQKLQSAICRSIFTIEPPLPPSRICHAFQLLVKLIEQEEETDWGHGAESYASLSDLIVGAYWFFVDYHIGQSSDEYATQCALGRIFKPGMSSLDEDSTEFEVYQALEVYLIAQNV